MRTATKKQADLFQEGVRLRMDESIELTVLSLLAHSEAHEHWGIAWSGGKDSTAHCWRDVVGLALRSLGGRATLKEIYAAVENNRPTENPWWREKVRQIAGRHFTRIAPGEFSLGEEVEFRLQGQAA